MIVFHSGFFDYDHSQKTPHHKTIFIVVCGCIPCLLYYLTHMPHLPPFAPTFPTCPTEHVLHYTWHQALGSSFKLSGCKHIFDYVDYDDNEKLNSRKTNL